MPGLATTTEERAAQVTALIRELEGYEARAKSARVDKDEERAEKWDNRADQVREQLRVRGADAASPHVRAAKRGRPPAETRA
jgi:hypothetical protein